MWSLRVPSNLLVAWQTKLKYAPAEMTSADHLGDSQRALLQATVHSIFAGLETSTRDGSLPEVVLLHRRRRAENRMLDALVSRGSLEIEPELRSTVEQLVRAWADHSFSDAFEPIESFEIQCARDYDVVTAREAGDDELLLTALEQQHRRRIIEYFGRLELRGIQTSHRVLQDLDQVYVPLYLEAAPKEVNHGKETILPDPSRQRTAILDVLKTNRQILIVGTPGSGKSTLVAYLATRAAASQLDELNWHARPVPFILTVRGLTHASLTPKSIANHATCDTRVVERAIEEQRAMLFVDGLDEAPKQLRTRLITSLQRFVKLHPGLYLIATSRPTGGPGEIERCLRGLRPFRLADLTPQDVDDFIDRWCLAAEKSIQKDTSNAKREATKAAADLKRRLAKSYAVQRIAVSPLLTTILCVVHRFLGRAIPEHRVTLYEKCTDALFYEWDRAKFPDDAAISVLDANAKRRLLMGIARKIHEGHAAEVSEADVIRHFTRILPDLGRPTGDAARIVAEIRDRTGVLVERRPGFFAFSHLTFQEYLCALDFVRTKDLTKLVNHYDNSWWHEVIVLAAGAPGTDSGLIARRLLARKADAGVFLAAQCLETEVDMPLGVRERVEKALQKVTPPKGFDEAVRLGELGAVAAPALLRALSHMDARVWTLLALLPIDYDPAVPAIAQCTNDIRPTTLRINDSRPLSVGEFATYLLASKALTSDVAKRALITSLSVTPVPPDIIREVFPKSSNPRAREIRKLLRARRWEKYSPKVGGSTAGSQPSR